VTVAASCVVALALAAGARTLHAQATSVVPDADGSEARPYRTLTRALAAAQDGDRIVLATGLYTERVVVDRAVTIAGARLAVLVSPDATGIVVEARVPLRMEGLSVQGGEVGVRALRPLWLQDVAFSAQRRAAVQVHETRADVHRGVWSALFDRPELAGLESMGGDVAVTGTRFEGPFASALLARGGSLEAVGVEVEGAVTGLSCFAGCRATVRASVVAQGRGTGLLVDAARLTVQDTLVSRWDHCLEARNGADLTVSDSATAFCEEAGVSVRRSRLRMRGHVHAGQATAAAIGIIEGEATIDEGVIFNPGATGIAFHRSRGEVSGTVIRGARSETEGDAVFAEKVEGLVLRGLFLEASARTALTLQGGRARAIGVEVRTSVEAAFLVEKDGALELEAPAVLRSAGPALLARSGGRIHTRFGHFSDLRAGVAWADCAGAPAIILEKTTSPRPVAEATCVELR